jgi:hypothetical protein
MINGTLGALAVAFAHPGGSGYGVGFTFPQVALTKVAPDVKLEDVVLSSISFEATKSISLGYTLQSVVTNGASVVY